MRCAPGRAGIAISRWPCSPSPSWWPCGSSSTYHHLQDHHYYYSRALRCVRCVRRRQWARRARCWCLRRHADQCRTVRGGGDLWLTSAHSRRLTSGTVSGNSSAARFIRSTPDSVLSDGGEIGESEHCQRDVAVPADPGADFVLIQADLGLALFDQALDGPAQACDLHQLGQRSVLRRVGQIKRQLRRVSDRTTYQQAALEARGGSAMGDVGPVIQAWPLGAVSGAEPLPGLARQALDPARHRPLAQVLLRGDRQDVAAPVPLRPTPDGMVGTIDTVTGAPGKRDTGLARPLQHGQAELGLGGEGNLGRNARLTPAVVVLGPVGGQVERAVDQRLAVAAGIAQEHADLAVLDPTGGAAVLPCHPGR